MLLVNRAPDMTGGNILPCCLGTYFMGSGYDSGRWRFEECFLLHSITADFIFLSNVPNYRPLCSSRVCQV